jgi:trehalose 6-phosphate phosphatase
VAIITGRAIADARTMLGFMPRYLIGNHGAEGVPARARDQAIHARVPRLARRAVR